MTPSAKYKRQIAPDREEWRALWDRCFVCRERLPLQVHEIEKKSQASRAWGRRCNYLAVCLECHWDIEHHPEFWPHARQLALKLRRDPTNYSLENWLSIYPHPPTYVTEAEVDAFLSAGRIA